MRILGICVGLSIFVFSVDNVCSALEKNGFIKYVDAFDDALGLCVELLIGHMTLAVA